MIYIPVSVGEVFDKITILEIKQEKIKDTTKIKNVNKELKLLNDIVLDYSIDGDLLYKLKKVNKALWEIEDSIRKKEKQSNFDSEFVELARMVYINNDKRAELKKEINYLTSSALIEEKYYE